MGLRILGMAMGLMWGLGLVGCADRAWQAALRADDPASYSRYLREHADSNHAAEARERLAYHALRRDLSLEGFEAFAQSYPDSFLTERLRAEIEPHAFSRAQSQGTADAYRGFARAYPGRARSRRAEGNAQYLEARGYQGDPGSLKIFATDFPESDFAAEALRTNQVSGLISRSRFHRVGLAIELAPGTPEPERLQTEFRTRVFAAYRRAGVELVELSDSEEPVDRSDWPNARLTISHSEAPVTTRLEGQALSRPGYRATTKVVLSASLDAPPVFERTFDLRVDSTEYIEDTSVLFSTASPRYWQAFFAPVATLQTQALIRPEVALSGGIVDVDASEDRSVVLFEEGRLKMLYLADPSQPQLMSDFSRPADLKQWSGVRMMGDHVVIYGEEGLEGIRFGPGTPEVDFTLRRSQIGTVFDLGSLEQGLLIAGSRGLLLADPRTLEVRRLMRRVIKGWTRAGQALVLIDADSVYISSLELLSQDKVYAQISLGKAFDATQVLGVGAKVVVLGAGGVVTLDLENPKSPRVVSKLLPRETGPIWDAVSSQGRIFLLGQRGLLLMDPQGSELLQSVDIENKFRAAALGRHVVAVGGGHLQTVDAAPLWAEQAPAARP